MDAFLAIVVILLVAFAGYVASQRAAYARRRREEDERAIERRRVEGCAEVVLWFANNLGYIARKGISREELETLIDTGIQSDDLALEIAERIDGIPGMILGAHQIGNADIPVKLTQDFRDRHVYIIGKSGAGKTTLLRNMIFQDLWTGNGIGVIAPEQEMIVEEILPFVPEHRIDDVVYFNPADTGHPVSFNPLHLDGDEDIDLKVDETLTIFKRILSNDSTPRIDEILRQSFYALLEVPGSTLLDIPQLLDRENPHFRKQIISSLADEHTVHFWKEVYPQFPRDAHLPIVHRLGRFTRPKLIRNILCQREGSLNFRELMDSGKIVLFNLSDGILGELNSRMLGQLIVSKFQLAVMGRAAIPAARRRRFYLYIDEFQTFTATANVSYEKILSRARKYRLALILAHQQTGQLPVNLLREIFGNVSTMVSFVVSQSDAARLSREFISEFNGGIEHIPSEELLALKVGETYCRIANNSFKMRTFPVEDPPDPAIALATVERSRQLYGVGKGQLEPPEETKSPEESDKKENIDSAGGFEEADPSEVF